MTSAMFEGSVVQRKYTYLGGWAGAVEYLGTKGTNLPNPAHSLPTSEENRVNGVTLWNTSAAAGDGHVGYFPDSFVPGVMEGGRLRPKSTTLVSKAIIGLSSLTNILIYFGIVEDISDVNDINDILTAVADGTLTHVKNNHAGFYLNPVFAENPANWRTVSAKKGAGPDAGSSGDVMTKLAMEAAADYIGVRPSLSPTLSVEVPYNGDVELHYNGYLVRRIEDAVDPLKNYHPVLALQTSSNQSKRLAVQEWCAEHGAYTGPVHVAT